MVGFLCGAWVEDQASRWRPPKVAARLAQKAPISSDTNSQSAAVLEALRTEYYFV